MYNERVWLNDERLASTGNIIAFKGKTTWNNKIREETFLQLSDCSVSARLHKTEDETTKQFIDKMKLLRNTVDRFINYLNEEL